MDAAEIVQLLALMLVPTVAFALALRVPRLIPVVQRLIAGHGADLEVEPRRPPIEQLAADLRRLLRQHETLARSTDTLMRARRLRALEAAITDCARDAGQALGLPCPTPAADGALAIPQLRLLLRSLAAAGLVLPPEVGLLAGGPRR